MVCVILSNGMVTNLPLKTGFGIMVTAWCYKGWYMHTSPNLDFHGNLVFEMVLLKILVAELSHLVISCMF